MTIQIIHTAAEGTLVHGTTRGDGTNTILKSAGFRWGTWLKRSAGWSLG